MKGRCGSEAARNRGKMWQRSGGKGKTRRPRPRQKKKGTEDREAKRLQWSFVWAPIWGRPSDPEAQRLIDAASPGALIAILLGPDHLEQYRILVGPPVPNPWMYHDKFVEELLQASAQIFAGKRRKPFAIKRAFAARVEHSNVL